MTVERIKGLRCLKPILDQPLCHEVVSMSDLVCEL